MSIRALVRSLVAEVTRRDPSPIPMSELVGQDEHTAREYLARLPDSRLLAWLRWNDPDGDYDTEASLARKRAEWERAAAERDPTAHHVYEPEFEPLTRDDMVDLIVDQLSDELSF